ncbi:MAG: GNAT family N-acetyltransferase [Acidobacteria bacterium]|nr:GNAT family N-acetyltransferase [Acidobacteriota bacterium]
MTLWHPQLPLEIALGSGKDVRTWALLLSGLDPWKTYGFSWLDLETALWHGYDRGTFYVLRYEDRSVAAADYQQNSPFGEGGFLNVIAVQTGFQRNGLGTQLLNSIENKVFSFTSSLYLYVSDFNTVAQEFYRRRGYARVGEAPQLVNAYHSELIFCKRQ